MDSSQDKKSACKLAQLHNALNDNSCNQIIEKILEQEGDINYAIPMDSPYRISTSHLSGYTALHLAHLKNNIDLFLNLLNRGADFTKKAKNGQTVLHMIIGKSEDVTSPLNQPFINAVLTAHIDSNNFSNPCDTDGLSHFHIACMTSHTDAVQFFLDNGVSVYEPASVNAKSSPGYTPLHFAVMCTNTEVAEILLARGANLHLTNAKGKTPLHLLIERRIQMLDSLSDVVRNEGNTYEKLQKQIGENEKIINMLLENTSSDNDCLDSIGLSNFHVACILQDTSAAQHLIDRVDLDHFVNMDSRLWPGYTALHFAAHVSIETVEMLMKTGANMDARDSRGLTTLDLCIERHKTEDIHRMMSLNANWENILFSDGQTKLVSFIRTLADLKLFKKFLNNPTRDINMTVPLQSPLWPGFTPLHLAVLFAEKSKPLYQEESKKEVDLQIIRACLKNHASILAKDSRGRTPLHLAYRLNKLTVVDVLLRPLKVIPDALDEDNLSHLHIVCAISENKYRLQKFALNAEVTNVAYRGTSPVDVVRPGYTPLHVCLLNQSKLEFRDMIRILLKNGADAHVRDADGLTPVHWLLSHRFSHSTEQLLNLVTDDRVVEEYGLSYLHVACHLNNCQAVRRLVEKGADVNLEIKYAKGEDDDDDDDGLSFLSTYHGRTPLYVSSGCSAYIRNLLLKRGANVPANNLHVDDFLARKGNDADTLRREFGWTKLHLACHSWNVDGFEDTVEAELTDINARVFSSSPLWKGYTPLHLLARNSVAGENGRKMRILLERGADVTAIDDEHNSPIGMSFEYSATSDARERARLLMKYHRDFNVNPVNAQGVSHFHIACYLNDVDAVRGFLEHGVDVNLPIDHFGKWCPGYSPLHLASQLQVVELLIDRGADVHAEDVHGCSVLAAALQHYSFDESVITKIIGCGADINTPNFRGKTPFEIAIPNGQVTVEKLTFCIERGFHVNSCNPITGVGYIAIVLTRYYGERDSKMLIADKIMRESYANSLGRTTLHHLVTRSLSTFDYTFLLDKAFESGCGIDERDNQGKTALHVAVEFRIGEAVRKLLMAGADINVADVNGNTPLSYACSRRAAITDSEYEFMKDTLTIHACRLSFLKLHVSRKNADIVSSASESTRDNAGNRDFRREIIMSKQIKVGELSICLHDFLSETGAFSMYRSLSQSGRRDVDRYFEETIDNSTLNALRGFLKLQYRKIVNRFELLPSATNSFRLLLGFHLPDLCLENIFQYLCNFDLKNIATAADDIADMRMDVD